MHFRHTLFQVYSGLYNKSWQSEHCILSVTLKAVLMILNNFIMTGLPLSVSQSVQSLSRVQLFATPRTAARQASLSITNSQGPPKPMSIELVTTSNHLILCHPLLLLSSIFPCIRVFSNESALSIRWPKYWSFNFSISPSSEYSGLTFFTIDGLISLLSKELSRVFFRTTI